MFTKYSCNFIKFEEYGWGILSDFCRSIWQQVNLNSLSSVETGETYKSWIVLEILPGH